MPQDPAPRDLRGVVVRISILLMSAVSAEKVAKWLGHSSTRMVFQTYGHLLAYDDRINEVSFRTPANPSASALRVVT